MTEQSEQLRDSSTLRLSPHSGGSLRPIVLVAEDNEDDYFLLHRAFIRTGFSAEMTQCHDGAETIGYLARAKEKPELRPALLLLDLKLPGASGFEVLRWVRKDPVWKPLVVNVLSSSAEPSDVRLAFQLGANAYTVKPMDLEKYEQLLGALFKFWLELCELPNPPAAKETL